MTTGFGYRDGAPDDALIAYLQARSGGVSMSTVAFGAIAPEGRVEQQLPWMWRPDAARCLAPVVAAVHAEGALACLQLGHGGRQVSPSITGMGTVAPSALAPFAHVRTVPRELTLTEIEAIVEAFGAAAAAAAAAGFDAVEMHAGHGYLVHQFLAASSNRRGDRYGGETTAERARFGVDIVRRIRAEAPALALFVRINGRDLVPGGMEATDAAQAAGSFAGAGAHAITVSSGVYGSVPYTIPMLDDPEAPFVDSAAYVRERVDVPVIAVGGIARPAVAEAALVRGACDAVAIGRALLADREWAQKAQSRRAADIRPCIATVDSCAGMLENGEAISCSVNPEVGRERRAWLRAARRAGRVVVVGAGPAGLEAACRAAELGHSVVLLERSSGLGGAVRLAARTPPLAQLTRLVAWFERRARQTGVEIRTDVDAEPATIGELSPELIVVATGSVTEPPMLDGYELLPAWLMEDLLAGERSSLGTSGPPTAPVVLGDTRPALACALACARTGREVTLLSRARIGRDASGLVRKAYRARLDRERVHQLRGRPLSLSSQGVWWTDERDEFLAPADSLVIAELRRSVRPGGIEGLDAEVERVGDARRPRDIAAAIAEGREVIEAFTRRRDE